MNRYILILLLLVGCVTTSSVVSKRQAAIVPQAPTVEQEKIWCLTWTNAWSFQINVVEYTTNWPYTIWHTETYITNSYTNTPYYRIYPTNGFRLYRVGVVPPYYW